MPPRPLKECRWQLAANSNGLANARARPNSSSASKEVVTAALPVIGDRILSGRTKDQNIGYVAEYLTALGIDLKEVRVVGDEETAIVDALNALRHRWTYVFTTGGTRAAQTRGRGHAGASAASTIKLLNLALSRRP